MNNPNANIVQTVPSKMIVSGQSVCAGVEDSICAPVYLKVEDY